MGSFVALRPLAEGKAKPRGLVPLPHKARSRAACDHAAWQAVCACLNGESPWPLVLIGDAGVGKSCLALLACDAVDGPTVYHALPDLCELLIHVGRGEVVVDMGQAGSRTQRVEDVWEAWRRAELAVLDELGTKQRVSDWHYEQTKRAIDHREGSPLIVISNADLPALGTLYDRRIVSRLCDGTILEIDGRDRRMDRPEPVELAAGGRS